MSAVRSDLKNTDYEDYMVMLEEDLYLAVPTHSPYGDKDSINLADTRNAGYICLARFQAHPPDMQQLLF